MERNKTNRMGKSTKIYRRSKWGMEVGREGCVRYICWGGNYSGWFDGV